MATKCKSILVVFATIVVVGGCASFSSKTLPLRSFEDFDGSSRARVIHSFDYDLSIQINNKPMADISGYQMKIEEVFKKTGLFETLSPGTGLKEYHLSFTPTGKYSELALAVACGVSTGTLFLLPTAVPFEYGLHVKVYKSGDILKEYVYREKSWLWFHITMLLIPSHKPIKEDQRIMENMLLNLLADMKQDGYI